jgi:hypothetical protein
MMDEEKGGGGRVRVYPLPEDTNAAEPHAGMIERPRRNRIGKHWLFIFPLLVWIACLGLAAYSILPLIPKIEREPIPITGGDPTQAPAEPDPSPAPTQPQRNLAPGNAFIHVAARQLETCSGSFRDYFILQQLAIENNKIFQNEAWRADVTSAMQLFHDDCQSLGTLPEAPPAYTEIEHWLKKAADEVEPATTSFTAAMEKEEAGQFQISIKHMIRFVDYIHNAENLMHGIFERKEI